MDVRCEKCTTVYEFDDSKVGEQGVTVKCTQCGNLFKVKRREITSELPLGAAAARSAAYVPPARDRPGREPTRPVPLSSPIRDTELSPMPAMRDSGLTTREPLPPRERTPAPPQRGRNPTPPGGWTASTSQRDASLRELQRDPLLREPTPSQRDPLLRAPTPPREPTPPRGRTLTPAGRPRTTTPTRSPAVSARTTATGVPSLSQELAARTPAPAPLPEPIGWMLRKPGSPEVYRFRELTTLQQWIVERKVSRDDEISRSGDLWKRLGGIAELASFFHVVEQAAAVARAEGPRAAAEAAHAAYHGGDEDDPALVTTAPMPALATAALPTREPSGPTAMGSPVAVDGAPFARSPSLRRTPAMSLPVIDDDEPEHDLRPRRRAGLWAGLLAAAALGGTTAYLALFKRDAVRSLFARPDARAEEAYRQGREYFLLDSDDAFANAAAAFGRARAVDDKSALPLAGLAEVDTTWAQALRDEAKALQAPGATPTAVTAARTLEREAQTHLDEAKALAAEALSREPETAEVNRAMADFLRVDGAPTAEVQRYLARAAGGRPNDAESAYVAGALALRDGHLDDAKRQLAQANQLNQAATQHALLRASMMLARLDLSTGDKAGARQALQAVLAANAQHDRAKALLALLDAEPPPWAPGSGVAMAPSGGSAAPAPVAAAVPSGASAAPVATAAPAAAPSATPASAPAKSERDGDDGGGYDKLVAQANHLSENGHARDARKLYDRALALQPAGLAAITGLGYCDLDGSKFSAAVEHFRRALALQPGYGEAIIGLAEAYKLRGDKNEAVSWYQQYLDRLPSGPKAAMARNNLRDLEPRPAAEPSAPTPAPSSPPPADEPTKAAAPAPPATEEPKKDEPAADDKPVALPKPPPSDEPSP